jgi:5-methylcytosine-specific restriction enzyme A
MGFHPIKRGGMGLKSAPARLPLLAPRIARPVDAEGHSRVLEPWRAWYHTARWKQLRVATLVRDLFKCRLCARVEGRTALLVCDHRAPHRGDPVKFWDPDNLQTLCKPCHDGAKQAAERRAPG